MNIFVLDKEPELAAVYHCDKHVVKMIVEHTQMLSTAHRVLDGYVTQKIQNGRRLKHWMLDDERDKILYKATHANHPCAAWCRKTVDNYEYLWSLTDKLLKEYTHRYKKVHKVENSGLHSILKQVPLSLTERGLTEQAIAMPDHCKVKLDVVESYRNYYRIEKRNFATWKGRSVPDWFNK